MTKTSIFDISFLATMIQKSGLPVPQPNFKGHFTNAQSLNLDARLTLATPPTLLAAATEAKKLHMDETDAFRNLAAANRAVALAGFTFAVLAKIGEAEVKQFYDGHKADFPNLDLELVRLEIERRLRPAAEGKVLIDLKKRSPVTGELGLCEAAK